MTTLTKLVSSECHPTIKAKVKEILASGPGGKVTHIWSYNTAPDHNNRRCIDFMIKNLADGQALFDYLWARRVRYGIRLIIWNGEIVRTYNRPGIPAGRKARYNGPNPHRDHPHVEFNDQPLNGAVTRPPAKSSSKPKVSNQYEVTANSGLYGRTRSGRNAAIKRRGTRLTITKFIVPSWSRDKFGVDKSGVLYSAKHLKRV